MLHHGSVTFHVLRLALLLLNFALQSHDLHILRHLLEVYCGSWLLLVLDTFNSDARVTFFFFLFDVILVFYYDFKNSHVFVSLARTYSVQRFVCHTLSAFDDLLK